MTNWVDVRNFDSLMSNYQKSERDGTRMPGLGTYLQKLIDQNEKIINLLENKKDPKSCDEQIFTDEESFKDGDVSYSARFEISTNIMREKQFGFGVIENDIEGFESNKVYRTKHQLIEEIIQTLRGMQPCLCSGANGLGECGC